VLGKLADHTSIAFVYQVCAFPAGDPGCLRYSLPKNAETGALDASSSGADPLPVLVNQWLAIVASLVFLSAHPAAPKISVRRLSNLKN